MKILSNLDAVFDRARSRVNARVDLAASTYVLWIFKDQADFESFLERTRKHNLFLLRNHLGLKNGC